MIDEPFLYGLTTIAFLLPVLLIFVLHILTIFRIVVLLFVLDTVLTLEAAYYSDIIAIAVLHIITIPVFFGLIYVDLINHHRHQFCCFLCGAEIAASEEAQAVKRMVYRKPVDVYVHASCIEEGKKGRRAISEREFRKGIPE